MKNSGIIVLSVLMAFLSGNLFAQTTFYNQFHQQPLLANAALSAMKSDVSVNFGYRSQNYGNSAAALNAPTFSVIVPIMKPEKRVLERKGAAGLMVLTDRSGTNGIMNTTGVLGSFAYNLPISKLGGKLAVSAQVGYMSRSIDDSRFTTGSQYDQNLGGLNNKLPTGETNLGTSKGYAVVNLGAVYYSENEYNDINYYAGISGLSVNRPNISSFDKGAKEHLPLNFTALGGVVLRKEEDITITPNFRYFYAGNSRNQMNIGALFHKKIDGGYDAIGRGTAGVGLWYSQNNAVVASFEINQPGFSIGLSYDFFVNQISKTPSQARTVELVVSGKRYIGDRKSVV